MAKRNRGTPVDNEEQIDSSRARRNLKSTIVEPFKQVKIGIYVMAISLIFLLSAALLIGFAFYKQYEHVMEIFSVVDPSSQWELVTNDIFLHNALMLGGLCVLYIVILFTVVFKMTHKVYGPLVGIERFVGQMASGDYSKRVVIRRGDELQRLADGLNKMAESMQEKYGQPERRSRGKVAPVDSSSSEPKVG